jgi:hypothetical protein
MHYIPFNIERLVTESKVHFVSLLRGEKRKQVLEIFQHDSPSSFVLQTSK